MENSYKTLLNIPTYWKMWSVLLLMILQGKQMHIYFVLWNPCTTALSILSFWISTGSCSYHTINRKDLFVRKRRKQTCWGRRGERGIKVIVPSDTKIHLCSINISGSGVSLAGQYILLISDLPVITISLKLIPGNGNDVMYFGKAQMRQYTESTCQNAL